jgi:formate--tetrahydrofolate ligase
VVALNRFTDDSPGDLSRIVRFCSRQGIEAVVAEHYFKGGAGAAGLAAAVLRVEEANRRRKFRFLYRLEDSLQSKINVVARQLYGADGVDYNRTAETDLDLLCRHGFGQMPVCIAKTPLSLSDTPGLKGRPKGFRITVNELRVAAGAGFVVAICGNIVTMPGLPKVPAAVKFKLVE